MSRSPIGFVARRARANRRAAVLVLALVLVGSLQASDIVLSEIMYRTPSGDPREEYLELFNRGTNTYNLAGWRLDQGVTFTFPATVLTPGQYLAVAADLATFTNRYPDVTPVVGGWEGQLAENGERVTLVDLLGREQDSVRYATEGDWGVRVRGLEDHGHFGWAWDAAHDGQGKSLELINPALPNQHGQNWAASTVSGGTPGQINSSFRSNLAPMILDVAHFPLVPRSTDAVRVTARILDESALGATVTALHRVDGATNFEAVAMLDDGQHGDGGLGDGVFGATLPARPRDTVVEFYIAARDAEGNERTWPAPVQPAGTHSANCLYQVDGAADTGAFPLYRLILTEAERQELASIPPWSATSDAQMNATFLSREAGVTECRYTTGLRLRGWGARSYAVKSKRVNFPNDRPWRGQIAINLNAVHPQSQILASILSRFAGVPVGAGRAVEVRENNRQLAMSGAPQFGVFAHLEALNAEYAAQHFPADPDGNLYKGVNGQLDYLGEDPAAYWSEDNYAKNTHASENDWSDLIELARVLHQTPDADFAREIRRVADVDQWVRYFAINTMVANGETALGTGARGDFGLYRGVRDPRFQLLGYDFDSTLGLWSWYNLDIFRGTNVTAVNRFLTHPEFAPLYLGELRRLAATLFAPAQVDPLIDHVLGSFVPAADRQTMKDMIVARNAFVLAQIPSRLTATTELPVDPGTGLPRSTQSIAILRGTADPVPTRKVLVANREAAWEPLTGRWSIAGVMLWPGINNVEIRALDENGTEIERVWLTIWHDSGSPKPVTGTLGASTRWTAAGGPYLVTGQLVVPPGVTLIVDPGAAVYFAGGSRVEVRGRLLAEGTPEHRIYLGSPPGQASMWSGITFVNATNENRLTYLDMASYGPTALWLTNATLVAEHVVWTNSVKNVITMENSSLAVRHSIFPNLEGYEAVGGTGMPPNGFVIFDGNTFGTTVGYTDVIDYTGGKRPGPILQVLNNVFLGGSDDGLDLDGTHAHIEGNVFMHFHKNNTSNSEASAIATGSYYTDTTELVVTRNVFFDNDYDLILKESAVVRADHNTFVGSRLGSLCFREPLRPTEATATATWLEGNIFWQHPKVMANLDTNLLTTGAMALLVDRSILPEPGPWDGTGNLNADPRFVNPTNDFRLQPGSPAAKAARLGQDMGAFVPAGAAVAGEPPPLTWRREASLTVAGPGIVSYRYRVNDGAWSTELPATQSITLNGLADGSYRIAVLGRNSAGTWQPDSAPTWSRSWTVTPAAARVRLSEVLAQNGTAVPVNGAYPDLVELYNDSPVAADLAGLSLSDDPLVPRKFTFGVNTTLAPDAYLTLIADRETNAAGLHLGFMLSRQGERLTLYARQDAGGEPLDAIEFGPQVEGLSIARFDSGAWGLAKPSFGGPNMPATLGDASLIRINEWLANSGLVFRTDFIELYNPDSAPVAVGGFSLTDEPAGWPRRHLLPPLSFLPARGYGVFLADGDTTQGGDHVNFRLALEQGLLGLFDAEGTAVDLVAYGPQQPDRSEGRTPSGNSAIAFFDHPTPGAAPGSADPQATPVVLNEVLAHPAAQPPAASDWVELYNRSPARVDLGGLSLSDQLDQPRRWVIPSGVTIEPEGYLLIYFDRLSPASATNTGYGLNAEGDAVHLFDRPENLSKPLDSLTFGIQAAGFTLARFHSGDGAWHLGHPTPGSANATADLDPPAQLKINEWLAAPVTGDDWFEVFNPGTRPVELSGLWFTDVLAEATKSPVPTLSFIGVGAGAYQVFIADGQPSKGANHVDFKLSAGGEAIGLASADGYVLDAVSFGAQDDGVAEGRMPDGAAQILRFPLTPTPGARNTNQRAPELMVAAQPADLVRLMWITRAGVRYSLERTDSLSAGNWISLVELTGTGADADYLDETPPTAASFYRLRVIP